AMSEPESPTPSERARIGGPPLVGRYVLREFLGAGSFGVVYRAHDLQRDEDVAIKLLSMSTPEEVRLLKKEFRTVRNLAHPNLVTLRDLHQDGEHCFFTMDAVVGRPLKQLITTHARATFPTSLIGVMADVASGL